MEHDLLPALPECGSGIGIKSYTTTALFATNGQNARPVLGLIVLGATKGSAMGIPSLFRCNRGNRRATLPAIPGNGAAYSEGWLGEKPGAASMQMRNVQPQRTRCE